MKTSKPFSGIIIAGIFVLTCLSSCQKEPVVMEKSNPNQVDSKPNFKSNDDNNNHNNNNEHENLYHKLRMQIIKKPFLDQIKIFQSKSPIIKAGIWKDKMESVLELTWTPTQLKLLQDVNDRLIPEIYIDSSPQQIDFQTNFEPKWRSQMKLAFDFNTAQNIANRLEDVGVPPMPNVGAAVEDCSCAPSSDWCFFGFSCSKGVCLSTHNGGCGTWWSYNCEGRCL